MVVRPKALARCPACNERRDVEKQVALRRVEDAWFARESARYEGDSYFQPLEGGMRTRSGWSSFGPRRKRGKFRPWSGDARSARAASASPKSRSFAKESD
jgi:hypothetical protein